MPEHEPFDFNKAFPSTPERPDAGSGSPHAHPPTHRHAQPKRRGGVRMVFAWIFAVLSLLGAAGVFLPALAGVREPAEPVVTLSKGFDDHAIAEVLGMVIGTSFLPIIAIILALCAWKYRRGGAITVIVVSLIASFFTITAIFLPLKTYRGTTTTAAGPSLGGTPFQVYMQIMGEVNNAFQRLEAEYQVSANRNRLGNVLLPERLVDPAIIKDARTRVQTVQSDFESYTMNVLAEQQRSVQRASSAQLGTAERTQVRRLLQQGFDESNKIRFRAWDYERAIFTETLAILDFMEGCLDSCVVENGTIYFEHDDDIVVYNATITAIVGLTNEQTRAILPLDDYAAKIKELLDFGQLPSRYPTIPVPATIDYRVSIDCKQVTINDEIIHLPTTLESLEAILGTNHRQLNRNVPIWIWDELGISAYIAPDAEQIDSLIFQIRTYEDEMSPRESFAGEITLFNRPFTHFDSPVTFNRPRDEWLFFPMNEEATFWRTPDDDLVTWIGLNNSGLTAYIDVSPPPPYDEEEGDVPF